jgi:hypothetical protein
VVSRINEEVTRDPCIAEKRDPPKTPATPAMWKLKCKISIIVEAVVTQQLID